MPTAPCTARNSIWPSSGSAGRFGYYRPDGGFFLWLTVGDGEAAARRLWAEAALKVLPGAYLGRPDRAGRNPGDSAIRVALVHDLATTEAALRRIGRNLELTRSRRTRTWPLPSLPSPIGAASRIPGPARGRGARARAGRWRRWSWRVALLGLRSERSLAQPRDRRAEHQSARPLGASIADVACRPSARRLAGGADPAAVGACG